MTSRIHIQEETRACSRQRSQALIERLSLGRFATYDQITANLWVSILFQLTIHDTTPSKTLVNAQTRLFDNGGQRDITNGRSSGFPVPNNQPCTIIDVVASMMERYSDVRGSIGKITSDGASCLVFVAKKICHDSIRVGGRAGYCLDIGRQRQIRSPLIQHFEG